MMDVEEDIDREENNAEEYSESFGDISCITTDSNDHEEEKNPHDIGTDESGQEDSNCQDKDKSLNNVSNQEESMSSVEDYTYDPTALMEVSDILGLVGKKWLLFYVSPLWNLHFHKDYLNQTSEKLRNFLIDATTDHNLKIQKKIFTNIFVDIEVKEAYHDFVAIKIEVINNTNTQLYNGLLLKSPTYAEKLNRQNLSDMPILMVQGNKSIISAVHNWMADHFDCVIRPYEFALYKFLWLIAISMGDAGTSYNESVLYHYLYEYENSKGQMAVKCYVESEFLRSILAKLSYPNQSSSEATSFHYSDLMRIQSVIEDHFKVTSGINVSKLKLKVFEAPKIASISTSGNLHIHSSSLMDLMLKYIMELENKKFSPYML